MSQGTALSCMSSQINTLFSANGETAIKTSDRNDSDTDMEKDMFNINKNQLSYGRGYVYSLQYHLVWCTKYRKKVLKDGIDAECKRMLYDLAEEYKFQMFLAHPELKKELWGGHLWNPSYCAVTVSDRSREQVCSYIEGQKEKQ